MSFEFRAPCVGGGEAEQQLSQLLSFLRQHVSQLNWVVKSLEKNQTEGERLEALEQAVQSGELAGKIFQGLKRKQEQDNFLGGRRGLWEGEPLAAGDSAAVETGTVKKYSVFLVRLGDRCVVCGREGNLISGPGVRLSLGEGQMTLTQAEGTVSGLFGVI